MDLPLPAGGELELLQSTITPVLNWRYPASHFELVRLYERATRSQWNAQTDIDWSLNVDPELPERDAASGAEHFNRQGPPVELSPEVFAKFRQHQKAWLLSNFLHGEQGALLATARLVETLPSTEAKLYAATQVVDEARHVEVYRRYLVEKMDLSYSVNPHLAELLRQILCETRWDITYLGMQIVVEGLALAAFGFMRFSYQHDPLLRQIIQYVMRDEARHVAFGVLSLEKLYGQLTASELSEREDFLISSCRLMHDRLLMDEVWSSLGLDSKAWIEWMRTAPFSKAYKELLFSKIVPNVRRLGLLTPRVREVFGEMGVLQFESYPDSTNLAQPDQA